MRLGHGPRRTVVLLWLWTALLSGLALIPTYTEGRPTRWCRSASLALALLLYVFFFPGRKEAQAIAAEEEAEAAPAEAEEAAAGSGHRPGRPQPGGRRLRRSDARRQASSARTCALARPSHVDSCRARFA